MSLGGMLTGVPVVQGEPSGGGAPARRRPPGARPIRRHGPDGARVLVVEDDDELASALRRYLEAEGFAVEVARDGNVAAWLLFEADRCFDVAVLDLFLPGVEGRELCRRIRAADRPLAVVMTTALGEVEDRLRGLRDGADDYLVKPFSLEELALRLRAVLRRGAGIFERVLEVGDLRMEVLARRVWRADVEIELTEREFGLLKLFLERPGLVLSRQRILATLWGDGGGVSPNVVDQYIGHLRRKIDRPFDRCDIETLHRVGYRLRAPWGA